MTIEDILSRVIDERLTPGRFPTRLIFVRNFSNYKRLVDELVMICDEALNLATFTDGDLLPKFDKMKKELSKYVNKQVLITSMSEYLRICFKRELEKETSVFPGLWATMQPEISSTKYFIPLFGGRELFDQIIPIVDERQKDFIWELESLAEPTECTIRVYSSAFSSAVKTDAINFQEWLNNWDKLFAEKAQMDFSLTSKLFKYSSELNGDITVKIINDPFSYVAALVSDGYKLKREWGEESFWAEVSKYVKLDELFSETIKTGLNIGEKFDPIAILARFDYSTCYERRLFWLWYKLYPVDDYCSYAIEKAITPDEVPLQIRDSIFELKIIPETYLDERLNALKAINIQFGQQYFSKLDKILPAGSRLQYLTFRSLDERAYAIKTVCSLLRAGAEISTITDQLREDYWDFAEYLSPTTKKDDEISTYFNWYRKNKILNRVPEDWFRQFDYEYIDSRNKLIQQSGNSLCFWVDGLGEEWHPLLLEKLRARNFSATIVSHIGRAILPTETEYNRKWNESDEKWDRLDKLSHNGMPDERDYFLCIARQLEIMGQIVDRIEELIQENDRVIITGDHGSSRLAALMFHVSTNFGITPPSNSTVRSHGRFCEIKGFDEVTLTPSMELVTLDGKNFIVLKTYEHFKQSGNAAGGNSDDIAIAGEVHGGMTPEECLVPVIVISRSSSLRKEPCGDKKKPRAAIMNDMGL